MFPQLMSDLLKIFQIWVWPERLQTMHLLGFLDSFTTKTSLTRVRAIPRYSFNMETLQALNTMRPTIGIMPSGLPWAAKYCKTKGNIFGPSPSTCSKKMTNGDLVFERYDEYTYSVPYSDHSCFSEIKEFVELLQPSNIKGIVSSSECFIEPQYYFGHFCGKKHDSRKLYHKFCDEEGDERFKGVRIQSPSKVNCNMSRRKRRKKEAGISSSRVNRVSLLRRMRRGIKLADADNESISEKLHFFSV